MDQIILSHVIYSGNKSEGSTTTTNLGANSPTSIDFDTKSGRLTFAISLKDFRDKVLHFEINLDDDLHWHDRVGVEFDLNPRLTKPDHPFAKINESYNR